MNDQNDTPRPIPPTDPPLGYWLRAVDSLLSREFSRAFDGDGIDRRDWMLLNALAGDVTAPGFSARLARGGKRMRRLAERGWIAQDATGAWTLTDDGRTAEERLASAVDGIRSRVAGAISPEEFATTMTSLRAIARELGWDESIAERFGRRGFGPRPMRPGFRGGFGPNLHHGFGPGRGHDPRDAEGRDDSLHHGHHPHHGHHGHGGSGDEGHALCRGDDGHDGHRHPRGGRRRERTVEQAYARGFDAGFSRGSGSAA